MRLGWHTPEPFSSLLEIHMKKTIAAMLFAFVGSAVVPVFAADAPKTAEDCKKMNEGDQAKIEACIKSLEKK